MDVSVRYQGGMRFLGEGPSGHGIPIDAAPDAGGTGAGARPMEMLLVSLGGCSGLTVVSILRKMRVPFDGFEIRLKGERQAEHPKAFTDIQVEYHFWGDGLEGHRAQIERAVHLSHERYCSVAATLGNGVPISHRVVLHQVPGQDG